MKFILINASNLHIGGGVQVAVSVIGELTHFSNLPDGLTVWASKEVDTNLRRLGYNLSRLPVYEVIDTFGLKMFFSSLNKRLQTFNAVLTIFGPLYVRRLAGVNIVGFAQPWIIYPNNEIACILSWSSRLLTRLKFRIQLAFFRQADFLLVELEHVRKGLLSRGISSPSTITVVHNCLSSIYRNPETWESISLSFQNSDIRLGFVGRNYAHKNIKILPSIINNLKINHGIIASIYVTFNEEEWQACDDVFREAVNNVGPLLVSQCPYFYRSMDAVIFPSLLECFSATPLEAMAMERPLFASDRQFNRDVCGEHAHYFDPMDSIDAAACIAAYLNEKSKYPYLVNQQLQAARKHAFDFSNPLDRANKYLDLLLRVTLD